MASLQDDRQIGVATPLGADKLLFYRMIGKEELGRPFECQLELLSEDREIDLSSLLGQSVTVWLELPGGGKRYFNGMVARFRQGEHVGNYARYHATLRPWLWFLTRTADCRIFQNTTVPDIILSVFRDNGFSDFDVKLSARYRQWEYCVQYRESDFNFVSRLMEQEGIYYYFDHASDKHTLVLADSLVSHGTLSGYEKVPYFPRDEHQRHERDHLFEWQYSQEVQTGNYVLTDFDFERPQADLTAKSKVQREHSQADFEVFDYPGEYVQSADGDAYARARIEELQAQFERLEAQGNARGLETGRLFTLTDCPRDDRNCQYLIVSATHELRSDEYQSAETPKAEQVYLGQIVAIDSQQQFRPQRITRKPVVRGPQTAVVVGLHGEEIWTDKYGRVKVQFHWDRYGRSDENSSCWIRVAQLWAGKQWGAIHIPRIGQEVIVDFLEGDPDRPIITGRVYNGESMPPYKLPDNQTQSGTISRSTKEGNAQTFNELRFEDKIDEEQIYFHAEKDFDRVVENNDTLKVGFDKKDKGDQTIDIYNDRTITLEEGNDKLQIKKGNRETLIDKGDQTVTIAVGKSTTEAGTSIELKVGASSIKIEPSKITIKSPQVAVQADGQMDVKAAMTNVSGDAMLVLKGGLVTIN